MLNKSDNINKIDNNINNNIINNVDIEKESFHSLNIEIDDKGKGNVNINNQKVTDASAPSQAAAHEIDSTEKNYTNEDLFIWKINVALNQEKDREIFYKLLSFTSEEMAHIKTLLPTEAIKINRNIKKRIEIILPEALATQQANELARSTKQYLKGRN